MKAASGASKRSIQVRFVSAINIFGVFLGIFLTLLFYYSEIVANLQTILNLLPNLNTEDLVRAFIVKTNDMQMAIYLSALIRSVIALHDLVNNRIQYGEDGIDADIAKEEEKKEEPVASAAKKQETKK